MSTLDDLQRRAMAIRQAYNELNKAHEHNTWAGKDYAMGFVGDVGMLMKLVMAKENMRGVKGGGDATAKLKHELGDCLWSLFVIAEHYDINLEEAFLGTMDELETRIAGGEE